MGVCERETEMVVLTLAAAAIASNLAKGMEMPAAVRAACRYVQAGIRTAPGLGGGNGPLNHFHSVYALPFSPYEAPPCLLLRGGFG
jgi:hydroxymethylpyrimidine/phosphomethylpyrimidine kinase